MAVWVAVLLCAFEVLVRGRHCSSHLSSGCGESPVVESCQWQGLVGHEWSYTKGMKRSHESWVMSVPDPWPILALYVTWTLRGITDIVVGVLLRETHRWNWAQTKLWKETWPQSAASKCHDADPVSLHDTCPKAHWEACWATNLISGRKVKSKVGF